MDLTWRFKGEEIVVGVASDPALVHVAWYWLVGPRYGVWVTGNEHRWKNWYPRGGGERVGEGGSGGRRGERGGEGGRGRERERDESK